MDARRLRAGTVVVAAAVADKTRLQNNRHNGPPQRRDRFGRGRRPLVLRSRAPQQLQRPRQAAPRVLGRPLVDGSWDGWVYSAGETVPGLAVNAPAPIPEPSLAGLLALAGVAGLQRRRRIA